MAKSLTLLLSSVSPVHTQAANLNDLRIVCSKRVVIQSIGLDFGM